MVLSLVIVTKSTVPIFSVNDLNFSLFITEHDGRGIQHGVFQKPFLSAASRKDAFCVKGPLQYFNGTILSFV